MTATVSFSWVDAVIVLVLLTYAVSGFRAGILVSASSLMGFLGGGALALWALPRLVALWDGWVLLSGVVQWVALLVALLTTASLGQWLGLRLGHLLRRRVRSTSGAALDALGGAVVVLLTASLVLWFLGGAARMTGSRRLSSIVGRSAILSSVDRVIPVPVGTVLAGLNTVMTGQGFPQVFGGVGREPITGVAAPDGTAASTPEVQAAAVSVVRVDGQAPSCSSQLEGSGFVVAKEYVVTNAHVVSGTEAVTVRAPGPAGAQRAEVVLFDSRRDLAVLHVPGLETAPLVMGPEVGRGDPVAIAGYPLAGPYAVEPARVRERLTARGLDIHGRVEVTRDVYSLRSIVQPGNSGGPVLDEQGRVVGVVFARSLDDAETGYALTLSEISSDLAAGVGASAEVSTGRCVRAH